MIFNNSVEGAKWVSIIGTQAISVREEVVVNQIGVLFLGPVTRAEAKVRQLVGDITTEVEEVNKAEQVRGTLAFLKAPNSPLLDRNMSKPVLTSVN